MRISSFELRTTKSFLPIRRQISDTLAAQGAATFIDTASSLAAPSVANAHIGGALLPGVFVKAPFASAVVGLANPETGVYTAGPSHGQAESAYQGACRVDDDLVAFCPYKSVRMGFYRKSTNEFIAGGSHGLSIDASIGAFNGIVMHPDGGIYLGPASEGFVVRYDLSTSAFTNICDLTALGIGSNSNSFFDMVLLPDGDLFLIGRTLSSSVRVDVSTGAYTVIEHTTTPISGVLTEDGRVVIIPESNTTPIQIYDPRTNIVDKLCPKVGTVGAGGMYWGGALLADGRVAFFPRTESFIAIFNPVTKEVAYSTANLGTQGTSKYFASASLGGGRYLINSISTSFTSKLWTPFSGAPTLPDDVEMSPYFSTN